MGIKTVVKFTSLKNCRSLQKQVKIIGISFCSFLKNRKMIKAEIKISLLTAIFQIIVLKKEIEAFFGLNTLRG